MDDKREEMSFTDALIGVLVIAILLVAADALRRMWMDRGRIRIKIDPRFRDLPDDGSNPELPSAPRVVKRGQPEQMSLDALEPPLMMEAEDEPDVPAVTPPRRPAVEAAVTDHAETVAVDPRVSPAKTPEPAAQPAPTKPASRPRTKAVEDKPAPAPILDVMVVHLLFPQGVAGDRLLQSLLQQGLRYGEMKIFHLHQNGDLLFSLANAHEPGYFNIDSMEQERLRAVTFFVKLPGPKEPLTALNRMLNAAQWLARELEGELRDENRIVLTQQMMEHLRERVQEFERRQRVPDGH